MALLANIFESPYLIRGACVVLLAVFVLSFWDDLADEIPYGRIPLVGKRWWDISNRKAKARFTKAGRALIAEGFSKVGSQWPAKEPVLISSRAWISFSS